MTDASGQDDDVIERALSAAIHPLDTVEPDADRGDLDEIGTAIGDADVIGMGEASHGTRELFQFKHRLFRYLVEEVGVRLLGLETNFAATLAVNDYVVNGEGAAETALVRNGIHRGYQTRSVLELIEWVRAFNDGRPTDETVRVHGFDVQRSAAAASRLESYFETVDPDVLAPVREDLDVLDTPGFPDFSDAEALGRHLDACESVVATLGDALDEYEAAYVEATDRTAYERASRLVWSIEQGRHQFEAIRQGRTDTGANVRIRDSAMAAQVQWLLGHEPSDRIALWGHNAHLTRGAFGGGTVRHRQGIPSLGKNLARLQTIDYYALGGVVGSGTVRAMYAPEGEFRAYEIEAPPDGSVPEVFGRVESPRFFLDLRDLPGDGAVSEWLDAGPRHYDIEGGYRESPVNLVESDFRTQFDGLIFLRETSAARGIEE